MSIPASRSDNDDMTLQEAAELLGVHYMTAYRYVRTGRLPATQVDNRWRVRRSSVDELVQPRAPGRAAPGTPVDRDPDRCRLRDLLIQGDELQAWRLVQQLLGSSCTPEDLYLDVLGPAFGLVGDGWAATTVSVAEEHRATAVMYRLVGRLGPLLVRRGLPKGVVVLGAPDGDHHGVATALVADVLRGRGIAVVDLGGSVPATSCVDAVRSSARLVGVGIAVSAPIDDDVIRSTIDAIRSSTTVPVLIGGHAVEGRAHARRFGADAATQTARAAVEWFDALVRR